MLVFKFRSITTAALAIAAALVILPLVPAASAQETAPAQAPAASAIPVAIGIVDFGDVRRKSAAGQSLQKQYEARKKQNRTELLALDKKLRAEKAAIDAQPQAPDINAKMQAFQKNYNDFRQIAEQKSKALDSDYSKANKVIVETLRKSIGQIAVDRRLTLVIDRSVVLVSATAWDISEAALAALNKALPAVKM
jgi:Skp family chaperone for outer membrane proteins